MGFRFDKLKQTFFSSNIMASVGKYNVSQMQLIFYFILSILKLYYSVISDNVKTCNGYFELHN